MSRISDGITSSLSPVADLTRFGTYNGRPSPRLGQGQVGAAGLRSVATFGNVDGDARQYEGDELLGTIVLVWLHMVQGRMVRGGGGALAANPP